MANINASIRAAQVAATQTSMRGNQFLGDVEIFYSTFTNPASNGVAIGEFIEWGQLPAGYRVVGGFLTYSALGASCTLTVGDETTNNRYLAATSVASAGNAAFSVPASAANGAAGFVIDTAAAGRIRSVCAGANVAANGTATLCLFVVKD